MNQSAIAQWAASHLVDPVHIDCTTTVMLKILDGKCKMNEHDKLVIGTLYAVAKNRPGKQMGDEYHRLIAEARKAMDEAMTMFIYEKRLLAETMISRPVMKTYKAWLRSERVLGTTDPAEPDDA